MKYFVIIKEIIVCELVLHYNFLKIFKDSSLKTNYF